MPQSLLPTLAEQARALVASPLELAGFAATLANVALLARNRVAGWPVGVVAVVAYGLFFVEIKLYADALLQVFFLATSAWGWYGWLHGGARRAPRPVTRLGPRGWALALGGVALATGVLGAFFAGFTDAARPFADSALAGGSVVAQLLLMRRVLDNWPLWIAIDVLYVPLYLDRGAPLTALLYALLAGLAAMGWRAWRRVEGTAEPA